MTGPADQLAHLGAAPALAAGKNDDDPHGSVEEFDRSVQSDSTGGGIAALIHRIASRPVLATAAVGLLFVALQTWWISKARYAGAFDVDEAGGIAASLRFLHGLEGGPADLARLVFGTRNGPLVPLLSVPLLLVGPDSPTTSMVIQPMLVVTAACGAAGVLASMGHRRASLLAGVGVMGMSISIVSSRSYQYSTGVAAFMALAMWALAASDRGRDRWRMIAFGAAVAAMLLSRTMAAGFVPALAVAALIIVAHEARAWVNLGLAALTTLLLAGPWWWFQWGAITEYLVDNAYGDRAHYWGPVTVSDRLSTHLRYFNDDFRFTLTAAAAILLLLLITVAVRRPDRAEIRRSMAGAAPLVAVWAVIALGSLALLSTSNRGFFFAHPLDVMFVAGSAGVLARLPVQGSRPLILARDSVGVLWVAVVILTFGVSTRVSGSVDPRSDQVGFEEAFVDVLDRRQTGNVEADGRLASLDPRERRAAADEWFDAGVTVAGELDELQDTYPGPILQSMTGEIHLMNANTLMLAEELSGMGRSALEVVNTLEPPDEDLLAHLAVRSDEMRRVLVIVDGRSLPFPDGRDIERFTRLAEDEGWKVHATVPMPDGGEVRLYTHPDNHP